MEYTNDKIKELIKERNDVIEKYNRKIQSEIDKEKAKYTYSYKRLFVMIALIVLPIIGIKVNKMIFPKTSIWSWEYYLK